MDRGTWWAKVHGVTRSRFLLPDCPELLLWFFPALGLRLTYCLFLDPASESLDRNYIMISPGAPA